MFSDRIYEFKHTIDVIKLYCPNYKIDGIKFVMTMKKKLIQ